MKKRITAFLLTLILLVGFAVPAQAASVIASESFGEHVIWTVYDDGTLEFSGTGATKKLNDYTVGNYYRHNDLLQRVVFTEGITEIGAYILYDYRPSLYDGITSIRIPSTTAKIGSYAFSGMQGLREVHITDLESWCGIQFGDNPLDNGADLYLNGTRVEDLVIPAEVTVLSEFSFNGCTSIKSVVVHENVEQIGDHAFNSCANLSSVLFLGDAPEIGEFTFTLTAPTCYYPADNATWTEDVMQDYGGTITWIPYTATPFTDVPTDSFYYDPVMWAIEKGITNGLTADTFGPDAVCNRAQVVTFLWRAAGCPEPTSSANPFVDVEKGSFYEKPVLWAVEKGITNGSDATHFAPTGNCNRAQVVTFLYRAFGSPAVSTNALPFTDVPAGAWYEAPIAWAVENTITNGISATEFGPNASCNRAQVVTFLYRSCHE